MAGYQGCKTPDKLDCCSRSVACKGNAISSYEFGYSNSVLAKAVPESEFAQANSVLAETAAFFLQASRSFTAPVSPRRYCRLVREIAILFPGRGIFILVC